MPVAQQGQRPGALGELHLLLPTWASGVRGTVGTNAAGEEGTRGSDAVPGSVICVDTGALGLAGRARGLVGRVSGSWLWRGRVAHGRGV